MPFKEKPEVTIYTDGSCLGNPGPGGWAAMLKTRLPNNYTTAKKIIRGNEASSTNNRMELVAVIRSLQELKVPCIVTIYTDSTYVIGILTKGWNARVNHDLIEELRVVKTRGRHQIIVHHVNSHSGDTDNELVDAKAKELSEAMKLGHNIEYLCNYL